MKLTLLLPTLAFLTLTSIAVNFKAYAQEVNLPIRDSLIVFERTFPISSGIPKAQYINGAALWAANNFVHPSHTIAHRDLDNGVIIWNGLLHPREGKGLMNTTHDIRYTAIIDIGFTQARIRVLGLKQAFTNGDHHPLEDKYYKHKNSPSKSTQKFDDYLFNDLQNKVNKMIGEIEREIMRREKETVY